MLEPAHLILSFGYIQGNVPGLEAPYNQIQNHRHARGVGWKTAFIRKTINL